MYGQIWRSLRHTCLMSRGVWSFLRLISQMSRHICSFLHYISDTRKCTQKRLSISGYRLISYKKLCKDLGTLNVMHMRGRRAPPIPRMVTRN